MASASEKEPRIGSTNIVAASPQPEHNLFPKSSVEDTDKAFKFLEQNLDSSDEASRVDLKSLRRRIDYRIMPIMLACYIMTFIDKVMINYAAVMGMNKDLHLKGNNFSNASSAFFIAYLIAELPTGAILNKVSAAKWLSVNVTLWGITAMASAAVTNYHTLLVARVFLGIFEASIAPCLMVLVSQWYTKAEQAPRFAFWFCGLGLGQIFGGLLSFIFQHVKNSHFHGWQAIPLEAKFITDVEKTALLRHVSVNKTGVVNRHFKSSQVLELVLDPQIWLLTITTVTISVTSGVISSYSSTLIAGMGYKPKVAALLNMPSGIISIISTLTAGLGIRYTSNRWAWFAGCCMPGIAGGALMSFCKKSNHGGVLAGIYLVNAIVATLPIVYAWTAANVAGHTKRVFAMALISASFSAGNIIGPQTFQAKDAPQYYPAKITVLATQAAGAVLAVVLYGYYRFINARRDRMFGVMSDTDELSKEKWTNLTDRKSAQFRYVY
ncbi:hypothetical protein MBLNU459_g5248t1 [Dothideomycetes sp. NU459]